MQSTAYKAALVIFIFYLFKVLPFQVSILVCQCYGNLLSDELVGVVVAVVLALSDRIPTMDVAITLTSPNIPFSAASRSKESTLLSLTVELNINARSTTLPHLLQSKKAYMKSKKLISKYNDDRMTLHAGNIKHYTYLIPISFALW